MRERLDGTTVSSVWAVDACPMTIINARAKRPPKYLFTNARNMMHQIEVIASAKVGLATPMCPD
jgi:hypothetical protein